jgi:PAS domain S-box-containing protein
MNRGGKVQGFVAFLIVVKKTGKIVSVSPTVKEILGLECEPEELLGTSLSSLFVNTETVQQLLQLDNSNFANMVLGPSRARSDPPAVKRLLL